MWKYKYEDDDPDDGNRTYTVEAVVKVKMTIKAKKNLDEDDLAPTVIDQIEDNCPDVLDTEIQEIEITEVE